MRSGLTAASIKAGLREFGLNKIGVPVGLAVTSRGLLSLSGWNVRVSAADRREVEANRKSRRARNRENRRGREGIDPGELGKREGRSKDAERGLPRTCGSSRVGGERAKLACWSAETAISTVDLYLFFFLLTQKSMRCCTCCMLICSHPEVCSFVLQYAHSITHRPTLPYFAFKTFAWLLSVFPGASVPFVRCSSAGSYLSFVTPTSFALAPVGRARRRRVKGGQRRTERQPSQSFFSSSTPGLGQPVLRRRIQAIYQLSGKALSLVGQSSACTVTVRDGPPEKSSAVRWNR